MIGASQINQEHFCSEITHVCLLPNFASLRFVQNLVSRVQHNKMAGLNSQLQEYLSKSSKNGSSSGPENGKSFFNFLRRSEEPTAVDDTTNGWFNQASKDPLLPGLVSQMRTRHTPWCGKYLWDEIELHLSLEMDHISTKDLDSTCPWCPQSNYQTQTHFQENFGEREKQQLQLIPVCWPRLEGTGIPDSNLSFFCNRQRMSPRNSCITRKSHTNWGPNLQVLVVQSEQIFSKSFCSVVPPPIQQ